MSDRIPLEILSEILKTLPVKSLLRLQSVCKAWKSLIKSSDFIARYSSQRQHLLIRYTKLDDFKLEYVSLLMIILSPNRESPPLFPCWAVIWNPSIRKAVDVVVPRVTYYNLYRSALGFGVCSKTSDAKIVTITHSQSGIIDMESVNPWQVEVFTLTTRAWRSLYSDNLPRKSVKHFKLPVVVDGCLYWLAHNCDGITVDDGTFTTDLIISFDLTSEEFGEVNLPDSLAHPHCSLSMHKLRESLVVVEDNRQVYHLWVMEDGVPKSFQKLFTMSIHSPGVSIVCLRGFMKTGEPLIELRTHPGNTRILAAYEPYSNSINNLRINVRKGLYYFVYSYTETLLLL
ncbi:putative F-box domain-containing protein [Helianthus annuus]|uniref:F-box domain-containing protein n=1 Tax=Helianthus annuus TaxID=4232 RepID=A0A9K3E111_HELAN|nr:putative F-box domain-containing protein [Helianthus annuus]KAJ0451608.1 putative F-box domain-containing protein [Helianthus annuus]KAJ0473483.1 putative F-box domain-containing protein [Helianthus annuus]KAJ0649068.1 putative F-box domain-containing protein [Helianthus annuus]KAJ0652861.1 putative F-box domain-containing protein [Helianthus annuus]